LAAVGKRLIELDDDELVVIRFAGTHMSPYAERKIVVVDKPICLWSKTTTSSMVLPQRSQLNNFALLTMKAPFICVSPRLDGLSAKWRPNYWRNFAEG